MTRQEATYAGVTSLYVRWLTRGTITDLLFTNIFIYLGHIADAWDLGNDI